MASGLHQREPRREPCRPRAPTRRSLHLSTEPRRRFIVRLRLREGFPRQFIEFAVGIAIGPIALLLDQEYPDLVVINPHVRLQRSAVPEGKAIRGAFQTEAIGNVHFWSRLLGGQLVNRLTRQILSALERSPVEQHLTKAIDVARGRKQPASRRCVPLRLVQRIS